MSHTVTVSFGPEREYEFHIAGNQAAGIGHDEARAWLHGQFETLECEPRNPVGKLLILDIILDVAKYTGEAHFRTRDAWAEAYVRRVAAALDRPVILVDVENLKVG